MYGGWGSHGNWNSRMPEFRGHQDDGSLVAMAQANNWRIDSALPTMADGTRIDISGGPFVTGFWQSTAPVVVAQAGYWPFVAFTATTRTRGGDQAAYAVTAMAMPGPMPYVHCYPESWRARATSVTPEVDLESGQFNDAFAVFAQDARTAYSVLSPRTMEAFVHSPPVDELWTAGSQLCLCRIDPHSAATLNAHLQLLTRCAADIPTSTWEPRGPTSGV